jgi:hypothetical protein
LEQFKETDDVLLKRGAGKLSVITDTVDKFCEAFHHSLGKYSHHASRELQCPLKILHCYLKLHGYKIKIVQTLETDGWPCWKEFAVDLLGCIESDSGTPDGFFGGESSTFHMISMVNRQSCRISCSENAHVVCK